MARLLLRAGGRLAVVLHEVMQTTVKQGLRMKDPAKKIEFIANVAIIVIAMLLAVVLTRQYLLVKNIKSNNDIVTDQPSHIGTKIPISDIDWTRNRQTLLLAISSTCHYCTESVPFYQRLIKTNSDTKMVAIMPQEIADGRYYLDKQKIPLQDIKQLTLASLGVTGTPTLILVDNNGVVTGWWIGRLSQAQEIEVLDRLRQRT